LYNVARNKHSDYLEQIVKGLIEKRGMPPGKAYAIAWGAMRKWARGGGKVTPEVRAAAVKALAEEKAKGAAAKASHAHAVGWDDHARVIEMGAVQSSAGGGPPPASPTASRSGGGSGSPQARVPAGQAGGGQFGGGSGQASAAKPDAHQQHLAHLAHVANVARQKAALLATAKDDKAKAAALIVQRGVLQKALASAGGKVSSGQAGATTVKNATTKTTAPAAKASTTAAAPAAASTAPAAAKAASATAKAATAAPGTAAAKATAAQLTRQIATLNTQINQLLAAANQATAQAAALK
jgi:hypothetical protein